MLPERPEHGCERHKNQEISQRFEALPLEQFSSIASDTRGRNVDEFFPAEPENYSGNQHRDSWCSKGQSWAKPIQKFWYEQCRNGRTNVDREIEPTEYACKQVLIGRTELVAHIGADARFDSARAHRHQRKSASKADTRVIDGEHKVAEAIHDRKEENGSIFAQNRIGQKRASQGQKINGGNKRVIPGFCLLVAQVIGMALCVHHVFGHEDHENGIANVMPHPSGAYDAHHGQEKYQDGHFENQAHSQHDG